jgi:hypothetical protein
MFQLISFRLVRATPNEVLQAKSCVYEWLIVMSAAANSAASVK